MRRQISKYFICGLQPIIGLYRRPACWLPSGHTHIMNTQMARNRKPKREAQPKGVRSGSLGGRPSSSAPQLPQFTAPVWGLLHASQMWLPRHRCGKFRVPFNVNPARLHCTSQRERNAASHTEGESPIDTGLENPNIWLF